MVPSGPVFSQQFSCVLYLISAAAVETVRLLRLTIEYVYDKIVSY